MGLAKELNEFVSSINFYPGDFPAERSRDLDHKLEEKFGPYKLIHDERTGYEHDIKLLVYSFDNRPGELVAIEGYYSSWDETDWDSATFFDVIESEKTVKVYTRVR